MTSAVALQGHYDELQANLPVLSLAAAPKSYAVLDLHALEVAAHSKLTQALTAAALGLQHCQICGRISSTDGLGFHISIKPDFHSRTVTATAGHFACSLCRAVSCPALVLELATPMLGSDDRGRSEALQQLFLHLAAVNSAPASITGNPEALAVWVQELVCRAYSLQVAASSIRGWQLLGPTGRLVQQGTAGAGLKLLQQLLQLQQRQITPPRHAAPRREGALTAKKSNSKQLQQQKAAVSQGYHKKQHKKQKYAANNVQRASTGVEPVQGSAAVPSATTSSRKAKKRAAAEAVMAPTAAEATPKPKQRVELKQQQQQIVDNSNKHGSAKVKSKAKGQTPGSGEIGDKKHMGDVASKSPQVAKAKKARKHM